jgi:hypothetical protein
MINVVCDNTNNGRNRGETPQRGTTEANTTMGEYAYFHSGFIGGRKKIRFVGNGRDRSLLYIE